MSSLRVCFLSPNFSQKTGVFRRKPRLMEQTRTRNRRPSNPTRRQRPVPATSWPTWCDRYRDRPTDDDAPAPEPTFEPSTADKIEAASLFGQIDHADFDANSEADRRELMARVARALAAARAQGLLDANGDEDDLSIDRWLDTLAPSPEHYEIRSFDNLSILDARGVSDNRFGGFIDM
jgi:hypothetical protein